MYCFVGVLMGTLVGVLPGLGPTAAIALLLPVSFHIPPVSTIIMLAGIYYGAMYGGSTTSILVNIPGEAASVITCLDGHQMAKKGRAGPALGMAAFGSFIAGTIGVVGIMLVAPPMAKFALAFGPAEYFSLMLMGIVIIIYMSSGSILKDLLSAMFGLLLGTIGMDSISGTQRLTFGILELTDGIGFIPAVMGLFGVSEILVNVERAVVTTLVTDKGEKPSAQPPGLEGVLLAHHPWDRSGVFHGSSSRPGTGHFHLRLLRHGEEDFQDPGEVRHRIHRGGGRARGGQQCRFPAAP